MGRHSGGSSENTRGMAHVVSLGCLPPSGHWLLSLFSASTSALAVGQVLSEEDKKLKIWGLCLGSLGLLQHIWVLMMNGTQQMFEGRVSSVKIFEVLAA